MTYIPTTWVDEIPGEVPVKYKITGDVEGEITASATIDLATAPTGGTPVNASNLSHMEAGIAAAVTLPNRQGGSATNWSVPGSTNYSTTTVIMQSGVANVSGSGTITITFPVAFSHKPVVFVTPVENMTGPVIVEVFPPSATQVVLIVLDLNGDPSALAKVVNWLAIGPAA